MRMNKRWIAVALTTIMLASGFVGTTAGLNKRVCAEEISSEESISGETEEPIPNASQTETVEDSEEGDELFPAMDGQMYPADDGYVSGLTLPEQGEYTAQTATPASGNLAMLVPCKYQYVSKEQIIARINQIRLEAYNEGLVSSYVPIKWSYELENIARIRAAESTITFGHSRTNGGSIWMSSNGVSGSAEVIAWNYSGLMYGIEQWYGEKSDYVNHVQGAVTGHYTSMINRNNRYIGLACVQLNGIGYYTVAAQFSSSTANLNQSQFPSAASTNMELEFRPAYYSAVSVQGSSTLTAGGTVSLTAVGTTKDGWSGQKINCPITGGVTWSSSNPSVARVDANGKVTGVGNGSATITCAVTGNTSVSGRMNVTVRDSAQAQAFSTRLYSKCLGRTPDPDGLQYWTDVLVSKQRSGAQVAYGFVFSKEYKNKNTTDDAYVEMLYQLFMDRPSDAGGKAYWMSMLSNGVSREYVFRGFAQSQEFTNICNSYGITRGSVTLTQARDKNPRMTAYVNRMYTKALNRPGEEGGLNYWCQTLQSGTKNPEQVAEYFICSAEFKNKRLSDEEYIKVLYRTFMGREYDAAGLAYWKNELKRGCSRENILHRFAISPEFKNIQKSFGL